MGREIPGQVFNPFFGGNTMEKLIPNTTQIPNIILDCVLPQIPIAEGKCLMYVCRRTFGFHKAYDQISYSQFVNGIVSKDGKRLDYGTGLNRSAVSLALKNLINVGALKVTSNSKGNIYEINLEMDCPEIVIKINKLRQPARNNTKHWRKSCQVVHTNNQSIHHTASSPYTIPKVVVCMDTQKKEKQRETKILPTKSAHAEILKFYSDLVQSKFGFRPKIDGADGKNLKSALSLGVENIRALIEWYLDSDKCRELENVSLSSCISKDSVNKWRLIGNKPQQPIFRKIN